MKPAKGLKIVDLLQGNGREVVARDIVSYDCTCRLRKGEVVFSTKDKSPFQTRVGTRDAYVALDQGIIGMRVGGVREIKVSPHLTYYERAAYPTIPEAAVLIYEVRLLRIDEGPN